MASKKPKSQIVKHYESKYSEWLDQALYLAYHKARSEKSDDLRNRIYDPVRGLFSWMYNKKMKPTYAGVDQKPVKKNGGKTSSAKQGKNDNYCNVVTFKKGKSWYKVFVHKGSGKFVIARKTGSRLDFWQEKNRAVRFKNLQAALAVVNAKIH